jgi:hypothetical protein
MKSSKELNNLKSDIMRLAMKYSKESFASRILLSSIDFDQEFSKWIKGKNSAKMLSGIANPFVLETIKFLETLRESHPDGMSKPNFFGYFVGTNNSKYLGVILSLAKIFETSGSPILEAHANIFSYTDMFKDIDKADHYSVSESLSQIESAFREYTQTLINSPFGGSKVVDKKTRLTKDDKKRELFNYLISNTNERLASSLETYGFDDVASEVRSDSMFMVNHEAIKRTKLVVDKRNYSYMAMQAQDVAKTILKRIEPTDYEYNYNLMVNTAMRHNMVMSDEDYDKYFYDLMLQKGRGSDEPIKRVDFKSDAWLQPDVITFLFFTLTMIMSQIKF